MMRKEEERRASESVGYQTRLLDRLNYPLRDPTKNVDSLYEAIITRIIADGKMSLWPLGIGHPDNRITRHAGDHFVYEG